jgi:hypothetical protein
MNLSIINLLTYSIISVFILFAAYWNSDYYKNDKFKVFLTLLSAIAVIFGILAIVIQGLNYNDTVKQRDSESFANLTKDFIHAILELFIKNQDMKYYYNDLLGIRHITKDTKRHYEKEHQISMLIFSKLASIVYYIEVNKFDYKTQGLISRTNNILNTFFKSKVFTNYWLEYKEKLSGEPIRIYIKKFYNL